MKTIDVSFDRRVAGTTNNRRPADEPQRENVRESRREIRGTQSSARRDDEAVFRHPCVTRRDRNSVTFDSIITGALNIPTVLRHDRGTVYAPNVSRIFRRTRTARTISMFVSSPAIFARHRRSTESFGTYVTGFPSATPRFEIPRP